MACYISHWLATLLADSAVRAISHMQISNNIGDRRIFFVAALPGTRRLMI
jgi:hypothetical protein